MPSLNRRRLSASLAARLALFWTYLIVPAAGAALLALPAAQAGTASTLHYAIPPQPLYSALDALAEHAGLQLVYSAELVKAIDSPGLTGDYTAEGALTRLLAGTGLRYRYTGAATVTLHRPDPLEALVAEAKTPMEYAGATQPAPKKPDAPPPKKSGQGPTMLPEMTVTAVTRQPRAEPSYALQQQFGSFDFYRTTAHATGPITHDGSLRYGFDLAYENSESFVDFSFKDRVFFAPVLSWQPSARTELTLDFEYLNDSRGPDSGIPVLGNRPAPVPISRNLGEPTVTENDIDQWLVGGRLSHAFTPDWKVALNFHVYQSDFFTQALFPVQLSPTDPNTAERIILFGEFPDDVYATNLNVTGRFDTGPLVLLGADYLRFRNNQEFGIHEPLVPIDIFNPVYGVISRQEIEALPFNTFSADENDQYGLYFQDQITLWDKLHLLGGGRYDWATGSSGFSSTSLAEAEATRTEAETEETLQPPRWVSVSTLVLAFPLWQLRRVVWAWQRPSGTGTAAVRSTDGDPV